MGPDSVMASRAALAAWKIAPDKYLPFHVALMESRGEMNEARVLEIGKKVGIDVDKLKAAMSDPAIKSTIDRNIELARKLQINGTPAFIIGGQLVPGAVDLATLREMVATARASLSKDSLGRSTYGRIWRGSHWILVLSWRVVLVSSRRRSSAGNCVRWPARRIGQKRIGRGRSCCRCRVGRAFGLPKRSRSSRTACGIGAGRSVAKGWRACAPARRRGRSR